MALGLRGRRAFIAALTTVFVASGLVLAPLSFATNDAGPGPHSPYEVPLLADTNPDPAVFEAEMVADELAVLDIGDGREAKGLMAFNGSVPGPEIRVEVGTRVRIHFRNDLDHEDTGIHWHGIELANSSDGTPLTQNQVDPGEEYLYDFVVTRPGVFWYHPHHHTSTNQVVKGLFGSLVVEDPNSAALVADGTIPGPDDTHTLVVSDLTICKAPGSNDAATWAAPDASLPWAGDSDPSDADGEYPGQPFPHPVDLCEDYFDEDGNNTGLDHAEGEVPNIQKSGSNGRVNEGQTVLTNGVYVGGRAGNPFFPGATDADLKALDVSPGQGVRFQIVSPTQTRFLRLRLTEPDGSLIPLVRIGGEGGLLNEAVLDGGSVGGFDWNYDPGEILLGPGDRADVVAAIPDDFTGIATMWTRDFERTGQGFAKVPTVPVAHLNVAGDAVSPAYTISAGTPLASAPGNTPQVGYSGPFDTVLDPATFADKTTFNDPEPRGIADDNLQLTATGSSLGINDVQGKHDFDVDYTVAPHEGSARYVELGDTLEMVVTNPTFAQHPFHLHGFSIQPITMEDKDGDVFVFPLEHVDNIIVPAESTLVYRIHLFDRPQVDGSTPGGGMGRWVFHCHIFFHAVFGMISELVVTDGNGNERPTLDMPAATVEVDEGGNATTSGTFTDPDVADTVTLSASTGAVVDNGDGTWTWSYTPADGPANETIYITAVDNHGNTAVKAFDLEVSNVAPTVTITSIDSSIDENNMVTVEASYEDPGDDAPHTATVDFGDGSGPQSVSTLPDSPGASNGTLTASFDYGDNDDGSPFTVTVTVTDDDGASGSDSDDVAVANVDPTVTIDDSDATTVNGMTTFIISAGDVLALDSDITDPGSDDLASQWDFGDGASSVQNVSLNDPPGADPLPSPTVNPRAVTDDQVHLYGDACVYEVSVSADDDDGGAGSDSAWVIATGGDAFTRAFGWWKDQFEDGGANSAYSSDELDCLLAIARFMSTVFDEVQALTTTEDAFVLLAKAEEPNPHEIEKLDAELLAAHLNFAAGALTFEEYFGIVAGAELVRLDPASTNKDLRDEKKKVQELNTGPSSGPAMPFS